MPRPTSRLRFSRPPAAFATVLLIAGALATAARAQSLYPTTAAPQAAWGGYNLPQPVPYQPTLSAAAGVPTGEPASAGGMLGAPASAGGPQAPVVIIPSTGPPPASAVAPAYSSLDTACPPEAVYCETAPQAEAQSSLPPGTRSGVFQKIKFTAAWLPRFDDDSLGMTDLQMDVVFGLPFFTRENPLVITPTYAVHFLDGPDVPDVPPRLHDAQVDFETFQHIGQRWIIDLDVTVGEHADDYSFDAADAFRITGSGAVVFQPSPVWKWVLGLAYVDRANEEYLPIAGFIYTPNDDVEYRLVFPAPKVSWRLPSTAVPGRDERWLYVAGEFGGGVWAAERTSGATDKLDITDWRIFAGLERRVIGGLTRRVEVGYIFGRTLQYASVGTDVSLDDTLMLRAGVTY